MTIAALRDLVERLGLSTRSLAALGAALQARISGTPPDPAIQSHVDEVLDALGIREVVGKAGPAELRPVLGAIRTELFLAARLAAGASSSAAWTATDPAVLQAAGDVSAGFPTILKQRIAPQLDGLSGRLASRGAAFLDIGVGVAAMAIEMARQWPSLSVVGIDPLAAAIAIARDNVRQSGLAERIELREQAAEDLTDEDRFDLAWTPSLFISDKALPSVLRQVRRALRPGGWLLLAGMNPGPDPLADALTQLRTSVWGGTQLTASQMEPLLAGCGFAEIRILPSPPGSTVAMVAARRPPAGSAGEHEPNTA